MIDLAAEWSLALAAMTIADELDLIDAGIPAELFRRCRIDKDLYLHRLIGKAPIVVAAGIYDVHPDGAEAFITPLRREESHTIASYAPAAYVRYGCLLDLVAWHPATPGSWALRAGDSEALWLGLSEWPSNETTPVWGSPFEWLAAGGVGLVPLTDDRSVLDVLAWERGDGVVV
jgi:hypothetical protein